MTNRSFNPLSRQQAAARSLLMLFSELKVCEATQIPHPAPNQPEETESQAHSLKAETADNG